jgi:parvulin-like peptidyl-prolyl isomerase
MEKRKPILLALLAFLTLGIGPAEGAKSTSPEGPIAVIADRRVEEADIQRAALVMERDPLRTRKPALWRKKLLDLCVDRELLALEAERAGFLNNPTVKRRIERSSAEALYAVIRERVLLPEIKPTAVEIDTARAGGLFRRAKLAYILAVADPPTTLKIFSSLQAGANFDSLAALVSVHPSAPKGGKLGWRRVGSLNPGSRSAFKTAKLGDLLGPYPNNQAHEIYKIEAIEDPDDAAIRETMLRDRAKKLDTHYNIRLLQKYRFELNPDESSAVIFAVATEKADSILASLDAEGRRSKQGVRPSLGILARADGDSITFRDIADPELLRRDPAGKAHIEDVQRLLAVCTAAMLPRLIARDARERGIDRDPAIARRLRLLREEASTRAMVAQAVPALDSASIRAYFESHRERYRRPAARRALVAVFASEDTARTALHGWNGAGFRDSVFAAWNFRKLRDATAGSLPVRSYAEVPTFQADQDPVSLAVRTLEEGQISPVVRTPQGYALAVALGREPARGLTFEEVSVTVRAEARDAAENAWVLGTLQRLRAATPARTVQARLDAVRLGMSSDTKEKRR